MAEPDTGAGAAGLEHRIAAGTAALPRTRTHTAGIVAATLVVVIVLAFIGFLAYLFNEVANDTHGTLTIAQTATSKANQQRQYAQFIQIEQSVFLSGFHGDCDAKAHQLTYLGQVLGGHPDLAVFQSFCATSIPAPPPLPTP